MDSKKRMCTKRMGSIPAALAAAAVLTFSAGASAQSARSTASRAGGLASAFLSGRHAEATADASKAVDYFNQAIELDPQNQTLLQNAYFLAAQAGNFAIAIPDARKAYEAAPRRGMAPVILAIDHYKRGEYERAWFYLEKTPGQGMNGFALPLLRAWGMAPTQPAEKVMGELTLLKNFQDTSSLVEVMAGALNEFYGRDDAALAHYDGIAAHAENERISTVLLAAEGYDRLGKTAQAKAMLAKFQAAHGAVSPTVDAYLELLGHGAFPKMTLALGMAQALYAAGEVLLINDPNDFRAQVGIAYAQTALHLNPDLSLAHRFVGATLAARGRIDESNAMLATIKKGAPGYVEAQMQLAENLVRAKKPMDALTALRAVAKDRPSWPDAQLAIGDLLRQEKKFGEAATAYDVALKLTPGDKPENWVIYYSRGIALERAKSWDLAEKDFRKALQLKPDEPSVLNYLGYSYLDRGVNLREARKLIEAAFTKRPDDGYIIDSMGWAFYMNGEFEKAVAQLEKAVESAPADATINEHLGDALWKVGRRIEARFQWQRALGLEVEDAQRVAISTKLEHGLAQK